MSREIDERIVQMRFESGSFNRDIQTSIHNLNELKRGLDFKGASKGFEDMDRAARQTDISALGRAAEEVKVKFGIMEVFALRVMTRISDAAINTGKTLVKNLTIDQVTPGWTKYEQKTSSVQTIMAATAKQFSDTGVQMQVVNEQLNKLNWFTDETSYNFVDMVNNIGKFTSNNIGLEQSVTAMQGIANWAAISGANANEASRAMYNLAQALSTGTVKLIDWKSIENANMATTEFKQTVIDIATEMGTLTKVSENLWKTLDGKTEVSVENFNEGLSKGWFTKNVLMTALDKYGAATNKLNEITGKYKMTASSLIQDIDKYTEAAAEARAESERLGETEEQTQKRIADATKETVEEISKGWKNASFEETAEALASFDNELMQFGLKSFKAAQEAKTFTEAIDSVKDAVSTGWMKSFEIIFGDYMQAKTFWTEIANSLYDIFASSGDARNEMLEEWAEAEGRNYFLDSIYAALADIVQILAIFKTAWRSVFGTMTGKGLADLTKKLNAFLVSLFMSEERVSRLIRIFRGLFSVLDIIRTTVSRLVSGALDVLSRIFAELNLNVGEVAASAGDALYIFSKWYKQSNFIEKAFDAIGDAIIFVIREVKAFIEQVKNFGPVKTALDKLHVIFGEDVGLIQMIVMAAAGAIQFLWNTIQNFHFPKSFAEAKQMFLDFGQSVIDAFDGIGINMENVQKIFDKFKDATESAFGTATGVIGKTTAAINAFAGFIKALDIDWAGVLLAGYGVVVLAILWKFTDALKGFAGALSNVTGVGKSAKGAMDSIKNYFTALKKNIETDNILKTAIAITALAVAMTLFARLDWKQVIVGAGAVAVLAGSAAALSFAMSKLAGDNGWGKGMANSILALAAGVGILTYALNQIPLDDTLWQRVGIIATVMVSLGGLSVLITKFGGDFTVSAGMMVGIAAAMFILIKTMQSIGREKIGSIYAAVPVVGAVMLALGAMVKLMTATKEITVLDRANKTRTKTKMGSSFGTVIGAVVGIHLMIAAIKSLAKQDPGTIAKGITLMLPVIGLLALLFKSAKAAGKEAASAGKMILYISMALLLLKPAINGLAAMPLSTLAKGGAVITALSVVFFQPLIKASKDAGKYAAKAGILLLAVTGALMILQLVIKTLGRLDVGTLIKGTAAVGTVILSFAAVVYAAQKRVDKETNANDVDIWKKMIVIVGIISALLVALSLLNPIGALASSVGVAAVFLSMAGFLHIIQDAKMPDMKTLGKLLIVTGAIGAIVGAAALWGKDWKSALAASAGVSMVLLALASMGQILKNSATSEAFSKKMKTLQEFALMLIPLMTLLVAAVGAVSIGGGSVSEILYVTTGMSEIMIAMGVMAQLMKKMDLPAASKIEAFGKQMTTLLSAVSIIVGIFTLFVGIANDPNLLGWDLSNILLITTAISEVLVAIAAAAKLMNGVELPDKLPDNLTMLTIFMGGIGGVLALIMGLVNYYKGDISGIIQLSSAISIVLVSLGAAAAIINKSEEGGGFELAWKQVGTLSTLLIAIGGMLAIFSKLVNPISVLPLAIGIGAVSVALAYAAKVIAKVPEVDLKNGIKVIVLMGVILAAMTTLLAILGALSMTPGAQEILDGGVAMMAIIGRGIGAFVGGIIGGLGQGIMSAYPSICKSISDGTKELIPFFEALKSIPFGAIGLIFTLVGMIAIITGGAFISGLAILSGMGAVLAAGTAVLGAQFIAFGLALKGFAKSIEGVDVDRVKTAAEAVSLLGGMEIGLNSIGHALGKLFNGSDDLEAFGNRLEKLGEGLNKFAVTTKDIDANSVSGATAAADILVQLEKKLTGHGGFIQSFFGEQDLGAFGSRLLQFGVNMKIFAYTVKDVKKEDVEGAKNAGDLLAKLEKSLQPAGGVIQDWFFGNKDLKGFGDRLKEFGDSLVSFNNSVSGNLDPLAFATANSCATLLSNLEKNLDTTGGIGAFWSGDSSLSTFGSNLKTFGACLYAFSNQLKQTDMPTIEAAISYIERLIGIQDLDDTTSVAVASAKSLIGDVRDVIIEHQAQFKIDGQDLMKYLAQGFDEGTGIYKAIATNAARNLANRIVEAFRDKMGIHSPSLVMKEQGKYVIQGLAEGIDSNDSAEEAMKKKADNIVSAFNSEISKLSSIETTSDLEFQLWKLTEGKGASDIEIAQKQQEFEMQKLANLAKTVGAKKAAMDAIAEVAGEDSESYQKAYQEYLQAQIDMLNKQSEIDATMDSAEFGGDTRSQIVAFANYMKENKEIYDFLGKSQEELEAAAYKAVYGLDEEAVARKKAYEGYMSEYAESFEMLGKTRDELDAFAKEKSGWEGIAENASQAMSDTAKIIADNIDSYQIDIQATIEQATVDAINNAKKSGSGAGAAADLGVDIGTALGEATGQSAGSALEEFFEGEGIGLLQQALEGWTDGFNFTDPTSAAGILVKGAEKLGIEIDEDMANAIIDNAGSVTGAIEYLQENGLTGVSEMTQQWIAEGRNTISGYLTGLEEGKKVLGGSIKGTASKIAQMAIDALKATQDSASPSKVTKNLGNDFTSGYSNGIGEKSDSVKTVATTLAGNAISALSDPSNIKSAESAGSNIGQSFGDGLLTKISSVINNAKATISEAMEKIGTSVSNAINATNKAANNTATASAKTTGQNVAKGLANGMTSKAKEVVTASKSVASGITPAMANMLKVKSPSRATMEIGEYAGLGLVKGMNNTTAYVNQASENLAYNTMSGLDYVAQAIEAILNSDEEYTPTITPVLDLDEVRSGAQGISDLLNKNRMIDLNSARLRVAQINASRAEEASQNRNIVTGTTQNYNFTQNNYSPKALNRAEIYRQTNNQFSRLKGATKV